MSRGSSLRWSCFCRWRVRQGETPHPLACRSFRPGRSLVDSHSEAWPPRTGPRPKRRKSTRPRGCPSSHSPTDHRAQRRAPRSRSRACCWPTQAARPPPCQLRSGGQYVPGDRDQDRPWSNSRGREGCPTAGKLCELEVPLVLAIEDEVLFYMQGVALLDHDIMPPVSKSRVLRIRISLQVRAIRAVARQGSARLSRLVLPLWRTRTPARHQRAQSLELVPGASFGGPRRQPGSSPYARRSTSSYASEASRERGEGHALPQIWDGTSCVARCRFRR